MITSPAKMMFVRCVDAAENVYDVTKVISQRATLSPDGKLKPPGTTDFYYRGERVNQNKDGWFEIRDRGVKVMVRECCSEPVTNQLC